MTRQLIDFCITMQIGHNGCNFNVKDRLDSQCQCCNPCARSRFLRVNLSYPYKFWRLYSQKSPFIIYWKSYHTRYQSVGFFFFFIYSLIQNYNQRFMYYQYVEYFKLTESTYHYVQPQQNTGPTLAKQSVIQKSLKKNPCCNVKMRYSTVLHRWRSCCFIYLLSVYVLQCPVTGSQIPSNFDRSRSSLIDAALSSPYL